MAERQPESMDPRTAPRSPLKSWLRSALEEYFSNNEDPWAFSPLASDIGRHPELATELKEIYDGLLPRHKATWRGAVADLLAEDGHRSTFADIVSVLLDVSVRMPAYEVLEVLPGVMANAQREHQQLFAKVVTTAASLSRQTTAARDCLLRLCANPRFSSDSSGIVFVALCRADPSNWREHEALLRPHLEKLLHRSKPDSDRSRWYGNRFLEATNLERFSEGLVEFLENINRDTNWLCRILFSGPQPLLDLTEDNWLIVLRTGARIRIGFADATVRPYAIKVPIEENDRREWRKLFADQPKKITAPAKTILERDWIPAGISA